MAKVTLSSSMKEKPAEVPEPTDVDESEAGPFVTISRQFGCYGFSLGLLLMEILNEGAPPERTWRIYHREMLEQIANETEIATELLERQRVTKPRLLVDFFRSIAGERVPSGFEVRRRIKRIIRSLATEGYVIITGQGGSSACDDLANGLSIRLEGQYQWRIKEVAFREGLSETKSRLMIKARDREREYLRKLYMATAQSKVPFHITYDCSSFTLTQIARHVVYAMKLRGCVE